VRCVWRLNARGRRCVPVRHAKRPLGYGTKHDGERYEIHLCEDCFFRTLATLKEERRVQSMFSADAPEYPEDLGLVVKDDFFKDAGH